MNGSPHVHTVGIRKKDCFPLICYRWVVEYGDQRVTLGVNSSFIWRWRNPQYWTPEKREKKVAAAIAKVIRKHDVASQAQNFIVHLDSLKERFNPGAALIAPYDDTATTLKWPSEVKQLPVVTNV